MNHLNTIYELKSYDKMKFEEFYDTNFEISHFSHLKNSPVFSKDAEMYYKGSEIKKLKEINSKITCVYNDGKLMYVGMNSGEITVFSNRRTYLSKYNDMSSTITAITKNKENFVAGCSDGKIGFYNLGETQALRFIQTDASIRAMGYSNDTLFVILSSGKLIKIVDEEQEIVIDDSLLKLAGDLLFLNDSFVFTNQNKICLGDLSEKKIILQKVAHVRKITKLGFHSHKKTDLKSVGSGWVVVRACGLDVVHIYRYKNIHI